MASTTSSLSIPVSAAISAREGSRPRLCASFCAACFTFQPFSFSVRLIRIGPSSRRNRLISPLIMGTA